MGSKLKLVKVCPDCSSDVFKKGRRYYCYVCRSFVEPVEWVQL